MENWINSQTLTIIVIGVNFLIGLLLYIWKNTLRSIKDEFVDMRRLNDQRHLQTTRSTDALKDKVHSLDKRVSNIETINSERLKLIEDIHKDLLQLTKELRDMKDTYNRNMNEFFQTYDLKKKE